MNRSVPDEIYEKYCRHGPRKDETKSWATEEVGRRFRLGRQQAGMSQRSVASRAGVSQSEVSRFERGMTPHMSAYKVLEIGLALGPRFPFGYCPHDHDCIYARPSAEKQMWERLDSRPEGDDSAEPGALLGTLIDPSTDAAAGISSRQPVTIDIGIDTDMLRIPEGGF